MYQKASISLGRFKELPIAISPPKALRVCVQVLLHHGKPKVIMKVPFFFLRVQPTRCEFSQFIYFCKTLYMF